MFTKTNFDNQSTNNQIIISTTSSIQNPSFPQSDLKTNYYKQIYNIDNKKNQQEEDYSSLIRKYQNEETEYINCKSTENYLSSINSYQNLNNIQSIDYNREFNQNINNYPVSNYEINSSKIIENRINIIEKEIKELNGKMDYFIHQNSINKNKPVNIYHKRQSKSFYKKARRKIKNKDIKQKKMDMTLKMIDNKIKNFNLEFNKVDQKALSKAISPSMKSISYSIKKNNKSFYDNKIIDKGFEISNLVSQIQKRLDKKVKNEYYKYYINKKDLLNKF